MDLNDDEPPPFWLQSTTTLHQVERHRRRHRHASSLLLNTGVLIAFLLLTAFLFLVILIPYLLSLAKQMLNPNLVKSSWNSLNILLVLFAIVCGFLSRKDDDQQQQLITPVNTPTRKDDIARKPEQNSTHWYNDDSVTKLRSSTSYPDLRQGSLSVFDKESNNKWRFYDDTEVDNHHHFDRFDSQVSEARSFVKRGDSDDQIDAKNVAVLCESRDVSASTSVIDEDEDDIIVRDGSDNFVVADDQSRHPPKLSLPSPSSPDSYFCVPSPERGQSEIPAKETNQTFETIGYGRYKWNKSTPERVPEPQVELRPSSPPLPRSPPAEVGENSENRDQKSGRKRGGVNVTKDFFTSFYHQSKRKRKHNKRRSYENIEQFIEAPPKTSIYRSKSTPQFPPMSPPPPPPPPPPAPPLPPQSVFHTLFSKKVKTKKKVHSISTTSTPPSPPPPPQRIKPVTKTVSFSSKSDDANSPIKGNESPFRTIPPPPPPPPFKMKPWRFAMQGDYIKIVESNNNSPRSGYSPSEDESISSPNSAKQTPTHNATTSLFCPSPDVNTKADDFIAKFRAKLTLEKSDSINLKQGNGPSRFRQDSI